MYVKLLNLILMTNLKNSVKLIGRLGKDPEVRTFDGGKKKVSFSLATTDFYKNQKGEDQQDTQWHNLVVWGKLADVAGQYLKKGSEVAIEGRLVHRVYETKAGDKRYITEVSVNDMLMLGRK
jgi:single-strand DNA-binding protein